MYGSRFMMMVSSLLISVSCMGSDSTRWVADYGQLINQGLEAYQQQDTGLARLSWERALLIEPRGTSAQQNIAVLLRNMPDEVTPVPDFILSTWWRAFHTVLSPGLWMAIQLVVLLLIVVLLYQRWYAGRDYLRAIVVLGVLSIILYLAGRSAHARMMGDDHAVVMRSCTLHTGPDDRSDAVLRLAPGQKLHILNRLDDWIEVARMDRVAGWTQDACITEI